LFLKIVTIVKIILKKKKDNPLPFCWFIISIIIIFLVVRRKKEGLKLEEDYGCFFLVCNRGISNKIVLFLVCKRRSTK
jgi:hypothetical protein